MKNTTKRWVLSFSVVLLVFLAVLPLDVNASDFSAWNVSDVTLSDNGGITWAVDSSGNGLSGTASGTKYSFSWSSGATNSTATTGTLTITFAKPGNVEFNYSYSLVGGTGSNTSSISGLFTNSATGESRKVSDPVTASGTYTKSVAAGEQIIFSLTGSAGRNGGSSNRTGTASLSITNFIFYPEATIDITFKTQEGGSYTVDGTKITQDTTYSVSNSSSFQVIPTAASGYHFAGWQRVNTQTQAADTLIADANNSIMPTVTCTITPIFIADNNGVAPFLVGNTSYWTWETAVTAALASSSKKIILSDSYTLPAAGDSDILSRNGLTGAGGTHVVFAKTNNSITSVTYKLPAGVTFLIPFDDAHTGLNSSNFPQIINGVGHTLQSTDMPTTYNKGTLTVSSNTTIESKGTFIVNGYQFSTDMRDTGSTAGPHGLVNLSSSTSKLHITSGELYCYGFIIGSGKVEVNSGAKAYEMLQLRDWRGFNFALSWMGTNLDTNNVTFGMVTNLASTLLNAEEMQKTNRSFVFSQYYVQNIEADLQLNVGASLDAALTMNTKEETPQFYIPFISSGSNEGLIKLSDSGYLLREYNSSTDRVIYTVACDVTTGNIDITCGIKLLGIPLNVTMNSQHNIFVINSNLSFKIESEHTFTLASDMQLLPEATIDVAYGGNLVIADGTELHIWDKNDWLAGNYSYSADLHQLHYVASRGNAPVGRSIDESAKVNIDGTMTISSGGNVFTTVGYVRSGASAVGDAKNMDKVITSCTGTGKIINNPTYSNYTDSEFGKLDQFEFGSNRWAVVHQIKTTPFVGKLKGGDTPYNSLATATYYSLSNNFWYNWKVSAVDENGNSADNLVTLTSTAAADSTRGDKIVGYVSNYWNGTAKAQSPFTFKVADGYGVSVNDEIQTPVDGIYTLSNIAADTTLKLHPHDWTTATCVSKSKCTICGQETGELDTDNHSFTDYQRNDDGSYTAKCDYGCDQTDTITNPTAPVSLAAIQLSAEAEVVLRMKVTTDSSFSGTIVLTEEPNEVAKNENETTYTVANGVISGVKTETVNGTTRYVLEQGIAAGEMTGDVTLEVFDSGNNRCYVYDYKAEGITPVLTRTVVDYVDLALASSNAELIELVKRMAIYGGYAQQYFGVDTSNLAYSNLQGLDALKAETETLTVGSITDNVTWSQVSAAAMAMLLGEDLEETVETEPTEAPEVTVPDTTEPAAPTVPETTEPTESTETEPVATTEATIPTDPTETSATESTESAATEGILVDVQEIMPNVMNSGAVAEETEPAETAVPALNFMMELTAVKTEAAAEPITEETIPAESVAVETIPEETVITPLETIPAETIAEETEPEMPILFEETLSVKLPSSILLNDGTAVSSLDSFGLEYYKQSVVLDSRIALKTSFRMSSKEDLSKYTFHLTYAKGGEAVEEPKVLTVTSENVVKDTDDSGNEFYKCVVEIDDIPVAYWDFDYIITVTKDDTSYALQTSVLAWVKECIQKSDKAAQVNMAKAMYFYNDAANKYFGK